MAFAVPYPSSDQRLKAVEASGAEVWAQRVDPMDMSYIKLLDAAVGVAQDGAQQQIPVGHCLGAAAGAHRRGACMADSACRRLQADEPPDPTEVVKLFEEARVGPCG